MTPLAGPGTSMANPEHAREGLAETARTVPVCR